MNRNQAKYYKAMPSLDLSIGLQHLIEQVDKDVNKQMVFL